MKNFLCKSHYAALLLLVFPLSAGAQNGPGAEVVRAGKLATAVVDTPQGKGSAFCISTAGVFATDNRLVEGCKIVKLVLFPGEREEVELSASVSHSYADNNVALLRLYPPLKQQAPQVNLTALPLGSADDLLENLPVTIFSFPAGDLPPVSATTAHVMALRKEDGVVQQIQLGDAINLGNSGGPVLNLKGEVIGMTESQHEGDEGLNFAVPVTMVRRLAMTPELIFDPAPIAYAHIFNTPPEPLLRVLPPPLSAPDAQTGNYRIEFQIGDGEQWSDVPVLSAPDLATLPGEAVFRVSFAPQFRDGWGKARQFKIVVKQEDKTLFITTGDLPLAGLNRLGSESFSISAPDNVRGQVVTPVANPLKPSPPIAVPASSQFCAALPSGLVAWWPMENNVDSVVGGYNGLMRNGSLFVKGKVGQAISFDGMQDYALVPYSESFNFAPTGQFTVETWVRLETTKGYKAIMVKSPAGGIWDWGLWCDSNNHFMAGHHNQDTAFSKTIARPGVWYHVAVTYRNGNWMMYANGVLESQSTGVFITQSPGALALGRKGEEPTTIGEPGYFQGQVDEPAIYNRALSASEINGIYSAGNAGKCVTLDNLKATTSIASVVGNRVVAGAGVVVFSKNKHFYELVHPERPLTWFEAKNAAENRVYKGMAGHLATIISQGEQEFVANLSRGVESWLGGFQGADSEEPNEGFLWITGEPFKYTKWGTGEPNNTQTANGSEDAVTMNASGTWNDVPHRQACTHYVVEYEAQAALVVPKLPP